jgi:hypothetical protein
MTNICDVLLMNTRTASRISGNIPRVLAVYDLSTVSVSVSILRGNGHARFSMDDKDKYSCPKSWHPIIICIAEKAINNTESLISRFEVSLPERRSCRELEYLFGARRPPNFRRASATSATYSEPLDTVKHLEKSCSDRRVRCVHAVVVSLWRNAAQVSRHKLTGRPT